MDSGPAGETDQVFISSNSFYGVSHKNLDLFRTVYARKTV